MKPTELDEVASNGEASDVYSGRLCSNMDMSTDWLSLFDILIPGTASVLT
jgi:hypothetical protein